MSIYYALKNNNSLQKQTLLKTGNL